MKLTQVSSTMFVTMAENAILSLTELLVLWNAPTIIL